MSGTVRRNDVIMTSIRRHYIISTSAERHFDVICLQGANEYNGQKLEKFPFLYLDKKRFKIGATPKRNMRDDIKAYTNEGDS